MSLDPLHLIIANIGAAIIYDKKEELSHISNEIDAETLRETLRFCHLFTGFPKWIRSLNYLKNALPLSEKESRKPIHGGLETFNQVYGNDSDTVIEHINKLDAYAGESVISYAYGHVLAKSKLELLTRERASVLMLALTDCPAQATSHLRSCLRHGLEKLDLIEDCKSFKYLKKGQRETLLREIKNLYDKND